MPIDNFFSAIPTACGSGLSTAGSATEVLKEEHISSTSFGVADGTLENNSGMVSGIAVASHISGDCEAEDSDVMFISTTPAHVCQVFSELPMQQ